VLSIQYFNQVIKLKPYLSEPYLLRAIAKIQLGDYTGATLDCNAAIERNPFQPGAYYTRGFIYRQTNQLEKAEKDFQTREDMLADLGLNVYGIKVMTTIRNCQNCLSDS
jgi:tetratricopeptide (TPR) repeat protein